MATSYVWVRQAWLFEYMGDNLCQIIKNPDALISTNLDDGYNMSLSEKHPWLLRRTVAMGHLTAAPKAIFYSNYIEP
jgi:hypothetical protein